MFKWSIVVPSKTFLNITFVALAKFEAFANSSLTITSIKSAILLA
ncbi:hypothetical protein [Mesoplasma corruscae]|nr:hypothetical protein [Mesoplasma corruscae]